MTDPQGAAVINAAVVVTDAETNARYPVTTNERGEWVVVSLPPSTYRVSVTLQGFKTATVQNIKLNAGAPATVNVVLELGAVADTVEVTSGAEVLQTTTSSVTTTLTGRQITHLPLVTRNALDLIVIQPGAQSPGTSRTTSINGLPKGSVNLTIDGINIQDNLLKSSDGFFTEVQPKPDAIEEVSLTTAGAGADLLGEGAAQVRFVTRSGSNAWHGGVFAQNRNTFFNSNYYFNNIDGLPRDRLNLNQFGGHLGGPIKKNKAFFFVNEEFFRLPQSYNSALLTIPTQSAANGIYTYSGSDRVVRSINLLNLAAAAPVPAGGRAFASTPDPIIKGILDQMVTLASPSRGNLQSRITRLSDYNRNDYNFQTPGNNRRSFPTMKLDYLLSSKHHVDLTANYHKFFANPDGVNGILPILPGTGTVLGNDASGGTRRISFSGSTSLRSAWTSTLTSELRYGLHGGNSLFRDEITPALFAPYRGYSTAFGGTYFSSPQNATSTSRRNSPVKQFSDNFTWAKGTHTINFGGSFTQINLYQQTIGRETIPGLTLNVVTGDPVNTGTTSLFTQANFPTATPTQLSEAATLYAIVTGRVSSLTRSLVLDEKTKQYTGGANSPGAIDRARQREFAFFVQDGWRATRNVTLNYGLRWDVQLPFVNPNGIYTTSGIEGAYGISGVGNLFKPGTLTGIANPAFTPVSSSAHSYNTRYKDFSPSLGVAWKLPNAPKPLHWLTGGEGKSVLRAGYAISTIREGTGTLTSILGGNQGRTITTTVDPTNNPVEFGAPGSVLFRDATLPVRVVSPTPVFPIPVTANTSVNEFDPNLRPAYVQSYTLSFQREIAKDTVVDVRYVGNLGRSLWKQVNLNEVNIYENGFLAEFQNAQNNLAIARAAQAPGATPTNNFGNQGLAGQKALPIFTAAGVPTTDVTTATQLVQGQAGATANAIAFNTTRMAGLTRAGYPVNFFVVNPATNSGSFLMTNGGNSSYNALQIEARKRMSGGLLAQASYVWSKSLTNMDASSSGVFNQPSTLRNSDYDKGPSPWDIRNAFKVNWIYELPFGTGRHYLAHGSRVIGKIVEGWELAGSTRFQSGSPAYLRSGRQTVNSASAQSSVADAGVVVHNLTASQLQDMMAIRKTGSGLVYYLPQPLIDNSLAAFELGGKTLADLNASQPYIGPPTTAGQFGQRIYLYGPWQQKWDLSVVKRTRITEGTNFELRASFLNAFNQTNFLLGAAGNDVNNILFGAGFGQTRSAQRDITVSGANDPGGRLVEFQLRFNF
ncbi:MAG TPA: carboxypeptidase-like regulatory domain-containing protein [Bryobacteraceae bacterium]|nr:carboxypeptidase-like regulatory domain-containing protein [Bryobacteraceae bacterium]